MSWIDLAFRSGMSSKSDLRGAIDAGVPVGVVAGLLPTSALVLTLPRYLDRGGKVFADSGAFSSWLTGESIDWHDLLGRYDTLALMTVHPENLHVVAPDQVGDQAGSLALLETWAAKVRDLIEQGCHVIVPIQTGSIPGQAMIERVATILGTRRFIVGVPSNRAAMGVDECRTLTHHAFHVLRRVQADEEQVERIGALRAGNPGAAVNADANWLRSRMAVVRNATEDEREIRRNRVARPFDILDHPRAVAVRRALEQDQGWGVAPPPSKIPQLSLFPA